jgi:hypothetical protein
MAKETKEDVQGEKKEEQTAEETAEEVSAPEEDVKEEAEKAKKAGKKKEKKRLATEGKPLDKMTVKELREVALEMGGIEGVTGMKKEVLLETIKKMKGLEEEAPGKKKGEKPAKVEGSLAELKEKIALLKKEKREALKAKDKTRVKILRRRISRLKKKTRKAALAA